MVLEFSIYDLIGYASEAIGLAVFFAVLYERILWKYNPFEKTPKLAPKYIGMIKSNYDHKERSASLIVRQTLLSVHITLITEESKSQSITASIDEIFEEKQLTYCYLNIPKAEYREKSEIHYGTTMLSLSDPKKISGQYYTDRQTTGDMTFVAKCK